MIEKRTNDGHNRERQLEIENAISTVGKEESELALKLAAKEVEVSELKFDLSSVRATMKLLQTRAESIKCGEGEAKEFPACGAATVADLSGCRFQYEGLRRIAEINDGVLELSKGVDVVIAALKPRGKKNSIMSTQSKRIREDNLWRRIKPGVYKLLEYDSKSVTELGARTDNPKRSRKSEQSQVEGRAA